MGLSFEYLGSVDYDDRVWSTVRARRPLLVESPGTKASKSVEKIARRLLALHGGKNARTASRNVPPESHHDLLEVDRGATDEEIRRAFKRAREVYSAASLCCYGLYDAKGLEILRARIDEAYDVLLDPARRRPYELSIFPSEPDLDIAPTPIDNDEIPKPPAPAITPDTEFTGSLLRAVRESQGVELREISQRTKIGTGYLRAIEDDDFLTLPAPVYVRGFVTEVAKCLHLDAAHVSRTYVRRYRRFVEERNR
jgi:flagellar biosynthesis protein FlhG